MPDPTYSLPDVLYFVSLSFFLGLIVMGAIWKRFEADRADKFKAKEEARTKWRQRFTDEVFHIKDGCRWEREKWETILEANKN